MTFSENAEFYRGEETYRDRIFLQVYLPALCILTTQTFDIAAITLLLSNRRVLPFN